MSFATAGCAASDDAAAAPSCAELVDDAAAAVEVDAQLRSLDAALGACQSYERYRAELDRYYPGIVGYSVEDFIRLRCTSDIAQDLRESPTCAAANPTTTVPTTTAPDRVYAGTTLDGRIIELRQSDGIEFVGEFPIHIQQTVDTAFDSGCDGLLAQRDLWATAAETPEGGDVASVYAQHAQNVLDFIGCANESISTVTAPAG